MQGHCVSLDGCFQWLSSASHRVCLLSLAVPINGTVMRDTSWEDMSKMKTLTQMPLVAGVRE